MTSSDDSVRFLRLRGLSSSASFMDWLRPN